MSIMIYLDPILLRIDLAKSRQLLSLECETGEQLAWRGLDRIQFVAAAVSTPT